MAGPANATARINWVAIDIARYWNAVLVETAAGKRHRFKMANSAADFDRLVGFLRSSRPGITIARSRIGCLPRGSRW
jgi:hypothetical protein